MYNTVVQNIEYANMVKMWSHLTKHFHTEVKALDLKQSLALQKVITTIVVINLKPFNVSLQIACCVHDTPLMLS